MRISNTFVTVDAVVFKKINDNYHLLLIQRKNKPFINSWALPGGFVDQDEDLEAAAKRELFEETQIKIGDLQQLKAFGKPGRDPRGHTVSIAFMGFANENDIATAADDAQAVGWFPINDLPKLAFDHQEIISFALSKI